MQMLRLSAFVLGCIIFSIAGLAYGQQNFSENFRQYAEGQSAFDRGDYPTALRIWGRLAESGDSYSQYALGDMFLQGRGVQKDSAKAKYWLERAASGGVIDAQVSLGAMYMRGLGIPVNQSEGLRWTLAAADCDSSEGQWNMALAYINGMGVAKNPIQGLKWIYLAGQSGRSKTPHPRAAAAIAQMEKSLSAGEIEKAKKLAFDWRTIPQCRRQ